MGEVEDRHAAGQLLGAVTHQLAVASIDAHEAARPGVDLRVCDPGVLEQRPILRLAAAERSLGLHAVGLVDDDTDDANRTSVRSEHDLARVFDPEPATARVLKAVAD